MRLLLRLTYFTCGAICVYQGSAHFEEGAGLVLWLIGVIAIILGVRLPIER